MPDITVRFLAYLLSLRSTILLKHLLFVGCSYPIYEIQNKLNALATFNVTGNEAKRNVVRSLAKSAGVDPLAVFKAGSTPVHISEIKEDGKWVSLRVKVIQLWDSTSDKITQTGLIGDETGVIKFTIWKSANLPPMEEGSTTNSIQISHCCAEIWRVQETRSGKILKLNGEHYEI